MINNFINHFINNFTNYFRTMVVSFDTKVVSLKYNGCLLIQELYLFGLILKLYCLDQELCLSPKVL